MEFNINGIKIQNYARKIDRVNNKQYPFVFTLFLSRQPKVVGAGKNYMSAIVNAFAIAGCGNFRLRSRTLGQRILDRVGETNMNWKPIINILKG